VGAVPPHFFFITDLGLLYIALYVEPMGKRTCLDIGLKQDFLPQFAQLSNIDEGRFEAQQLTLASTQGHKNHGGPDANTMAR